jgi:hypothetical protein
MRASLERMQHGNRRSLATRARSVTPDGLPVARAMVLNKRSIQPIDSGTCRQVQVTPLSSFQQPSPKAGSDQVHEQVGKDVGHQVSSPHIQPCENATQHERLQYVDPIPSIVPDGKQ